MKKTLFVLMILAATMVLLTDVFARGIGGGGGGWGRNAQYQRMYDPKNS